MSRKRKANNDALFTRREVLEAGMMGVAAAFVPIGCSAPNNKKGDSSVAPVSEIPSFELERVTITEGQEGMQAGKYTARSRTEKYLGRVDAIDRSGPALNPVIE